MIWNSYDRCGRDSIEKGMIQALFPMKLWICERTSAGSLCPVTNGYTAYATTRTMLTLNNDDLKNMLVRETQVFIPCIALLKRKKHHQS